MPSSNSPIIISSCAYLVLSADMHDPLDSHDIHSCTTCIFPEYGGLLLLCLFGHQQFHLWSSLLLHPYRLRLRPRLHLRLCQCTPCMYGPIPFICCLLQAPPPRHPDHQVLC
jgi:hypothetical protein